MPTPQPILGTGQQHVPLSAVPRYVPLSTLPPALAFPVVDPREIEHEKTLIEQVWPDDDFTWKGRKHRAVFLQDPAANRKQRAFEKFMADVSLLGIPEAPQTAARRSRSPSAYHPSAYHPRAYHPSTYHRSFRGYGRSLCAKTDGPSSQRSGAPRAFLQTYRCKKKRS